MKFILKVLTVFCIFLLASCNKQDRETEIIQLPIHRQFKTETMPVKLSEIDSFTEYKDNLFIVNSIAELPEDIHFGVDDFKRADINFSEYSLVIAYQFIIGDVVAYKYNWLYNNWFDRYQFNISLDKVKDSEYVDGEIERCTYMRSAILVRHIPSDSGWTISLSVNER